MFKKMFIYIENRSLNGIIMLFLLKNEIGLIKIRVQDVSFLTVGIRNLETVSRSLNFLYRCVETHHSVKTLSSLILQQHNILITVYKLGKYLIWSPFIVRLLLCVFPEKSFLNDLNPFC